MTFTLKGKNIPAGVTVDLGGELGYDLFGNGLYVGVCEVAEALGDTELQWSGDASEWRDLTVSVEGDTYTVTVYGERDYAVLS